MHESSGGFTWQLQMSYYQIGYHFGFVVYLMVNCVGRLRVWSDKLQLRRFSFKLDVI